MSYHPTDPGCLTICIKPNAQDVNIDLPDKKELLLYAHMSAIQRDYYRLAEVRPRCLIYVDMYRRRGFWLNDRTHQSIDFSRKS